MNYLHQPTKIISTEPIMFTSTINYTNELRSIAGIARLADPSFGIQKRLSAAQQNDGNRN